MSSPMNEDSDRQSSPARADDGRMAVMSAEQSGVWPAAPERDQRATEGSDSNLEGGGEDAEAGRRFTEQLAVGLES